MSSQLQNMYQEVRTVLFNHNQAAMDIDTLYHAAIFPTILPQNGMKAQRRWLYTQGNANAVDLEKAFVQIEAAKSDMIDHGPLTGHVYQDFNAAINRRISFTNKARRTKAAAKAAHTSTEIALPSWARSFRDHHLVSQLHLNQASPDDSLLAERQYLNLHHGSGLRWFIVEPNQAPIDVNTWAQQSEQVSHPYYDKWFSIEQAFIREMLYQIQPQLDDGNGNQSLMQFRADYLNQVKFQQQHPYRGFVYDKTRATKTMPELESPYDAVSPVTTWQLVNYIECHGGRVNWTGAMGHLMMNINMDGEIISIDESTMSQPQATDISSDTESEWKQVVHAYVQQPVLQRHGYPELAQKQGANKAATWRGNHRY